MFKNRSTTGLQGKKEDSVEELRNEFTWSKSRDSSFRQCRRAYYLNHYGSWGGWRDDAPDDIRELYIMKNLGNRASWIGIIVHDAAERAVKSIRDGRKWPLEAALEEVRGRLEAEIEISSRGGYRANQTVPWGERRIRVKGLQEHYYNMAIPDEAWRQDIERALFCIRNLYRSSPFRRLESLEPDAFLTVEDLKSFPVRGINVWVKLDLAVKGKDDKVVILDWKTGASHYQKDIELQLGIYGLFGSRQWEVEPDKIVGFDVNLRDLNTRKHEINTETLSNVEAYIEKSADDMRALLDDPEENIADIERFEMSTNPRTCARCRFRRACGRE